jgi:hypothetical protein
MKPILATIALVLSVVCSVSAQTPDSRLVVAVLDFQISETMDRNLASTLADYTRETAVRAGTYDLVDRGNIEAIMQEQELQASELVSEEKAVEIGKLAGAELIAKGSVTLTDGAYAISLQLIDVETARIVKVATRTYRGDTQGLLEAVQKVGTALFAVLKPVLPWQAAVRSALVPGLGQITSGRRGMGWTLAGVSAALLGAGGAVGYLLYDGYQDYLSAAGYLTDYDAVWATVTGRRNALIGVAAAFGAVYAYAIVDALVFTARPKGDTP